MMPARSVKLIRFYAILRIIFKELGRFKLQQILAYITMGVGAFALASTIFVGEGALRELWKDLNNFLSNRAVVYADIDPTGEILKARQDHFFTDSDLKYLQENVHGARYVVPKLSKFKPVFIGERSININIDGVAAEMLEDEIYRPVSGRIFTDMANVSGVQEALVTESMARAFELEAGRSNMLIKSLLFRVVGVIPDPPKLQEGQKERVVIPYNTANLLWGAPDQIATIEVAWQNVDDMERVMGELNRALGEIRVQGSFHVRSSQFAMKNRQNIIANFMLYGVIQSFFSILIASIGVFNVLLTNVVKQMRTFAIRIVMGATPNEMMLMVLLESAFIGIIGAVIGVIFAYFFSPYICIMMAKYMPKAGVVVPFFNFQGVMIPIAVCALSSVLAGIIPAMKARQTDILKVIRAE